MLALFQQTASVKGVEFMHKSIQTDAAVILNSLTGLIPGNTDQPAVNSEDNTFLFLEGEIFNLGELRARVRHSENACSPCQILLDLYSLYGDSFITLLNGEFNIVIYHKDRNRLLVFTDHIASMPMYYVHDADNFFFGSEKKFILPALSQPPSIDSVGLLQIFAHRYNLDDRTFLDGVKRMTPGTLISFENGRLTESQYDFLCFSVPATVPDSTDLIHQWSSILRDATQSRLMGKSRVLLSLSGGLDSRAIAAAIPRNFRPIISRTAGLRDSADVIAAEKIAQQLRFNHIYENSASTRYSDILAQIVWRTECETHFTNASSIAEHRQAKEHGDFLAGGWIGDVSSGGHIPAPLLFVKNREDFIERLFSRHVIFPKHWLRRVFTHDYLEETFPRLREAFQKSFDNFTSGTNVQMYEIWDLYQRQRRQTTSSMPIDSYWFEKIRPFYDKNYLQFTLTLPTRLRFGQVLYQSMIHSIGPEIRKIPNANNGLLLRASISGNLINKGITLSGQTISRGRRRLLKNRTNSLKPQTKDNPAAKIRDDEIFREMIENHLSSTDFDTAVFDRGGIKELLDQHYMGGLDHSYLLGYVATFFVGLPYFTRPLRQCPSEAEPIVR
jgi:asparagine synthase (glutamine-hydrolysing)